MSERNWSGTESEATRLADGAGGADWDHGAVQRALAWLYQRLGARVVLVAMSIGLAVPVMTGAVLWVLILRYLSASIAEEGFGAIVAMSFALLLAALAIGCFLTRHGFRTALSWSGPDRTVERAPAVWSTTVRLPYTFAAYGMGTCMPIIAPLAGAFILLTEISPLVAIPFVLMGVAAILAGTALIVFAIELVLRPLVEDVAAHLPDDFEPSGPAWRLRTKVLLPLPVVTLFAALTVGAFVDAPAGSVLRPSLALAIGLATAGVAGFIFLVVTRSNLDPLDELLAATRRVRQGDIHTRVRVVTADDLGQLAHSFNRMLGDLRQHADELRASRARIVSAGDAERRRVERDLHDGAQQHLILLGLKLALAERLIEQDPEAAKAMQGELRGDLDRALSALRDLAPGIYPPLLENEGLGGALGEAVERAAIPATLQCDGTGRYPRELEAAVYFCCLEALQNAAKHAGEGARATVELDERDGALRFSVADDGHGYDAAATANGGAGLQNMMDRIGALGGSLRVESAPGKGTRVIGVLPLGAAVSPGSSPEADR